jgi:hypothetical protein
VIVRRNVHYAKERRVPCIYFFNCPETQSWREKFIENKWLMIKEEISFKKIVGCTKSTNLRNVGILLYEHCSTEGHKYSAKTFPCCLSPLQVQ